MTPRAFYERTIGELELTKAHHESIVSDFVDIICLNPGDPWNWPYFLEYEYQLRRYTAWLDRARGWLADLNAEEVSA